MNTNVGDGAGATGDLQPLPGEDGEMKVVYLDLPARPEDIAKLEIGSAVYLTGVVYTAREGVYKRVLEQGFELPEPKLAEISNANFHCSPAAAEDGQGGFKVGAVTATASFRFTRSMGPWIDRSGAKLIIGKGGMTVEDYTQVLAPKGAVYLTTVGYGTGALLGRGIRRVRAVHWLSELGIAQAMWMFEVERMGPFLVESDLQGRSLFAAHGERINAGIEALYAGLKSPVLHRYGETDDRKREVM